MFSITWKSYLLMYKNGIVFIQQNRLISPACSLRGADQCPVAEPCPAHSPALRVAALTHALGRSPTPPGPWPDQAWPCTFLLFRHLSSWIGTCFRCKPPSPLEDSPESPGKGSGARCVSYVPWPNKILFCWVPPGLPLGDTWIIRGLQKGKKLRFEAVKSFAHGYPVPHNCTHLTR